MGVQESRFINAMRHISSTKLLVGTLIVVGALAIAYWEYAHIGCNSKAKTFVLENWAKLNSLTDSKRGYDLVYEVCMRSKGF